MVEEQISTEGLIHRYCSIHFKPHASHGKDQQKITFEQCL